jgi:hypothetical protein
MVKIHQCIALDLCGFVSSTRTLMLDPFVATILNGVGSVAQFV